MQPAEISVIIPTFNALSNLKRTINCLEQQQPDPRLFEVIVVDDGSSDGTRAWLENYNGILDLKAVIFEANRGRSAARNAGARKSSKPLLLLLDGDMEFSPDFVSAHAALHNGRKIAVIGSVLYRRLKRISGYARYLEKRGAVKLKPGDSVPGRYFLSGNASVAAKLFEEAGGFNENLRFYGEDIDFGLRLRKAGADILFAKSLQVQHLHIRTLPAALEIAKQFGAIGIPELVKIHPELYSQLKLDWTERWGLCRIPRKLLISSPVYNMILAVMRILDYYRAPGIFYSYLIFRNYYTGFRFRNKSVQCTR